MSRKKRKGYLKAKRRNRGIRKAQRNDDRICEKCNKKGLPENEITRHHIQPKRFFKGKGKIALLCRRCHDILEKLIPYKPKLCVSEYFDIFNNFLNSKTSKGQDEVPKIFNSLLARSSSVHIFSNNKIPTLRRLR